MNGGEARWAASFSWVGYTWKSELRTQADRVELHFREVLHEGFTGEHNPLHMLERALVLAAFSVRRLVEKRLLTDELSASVHSVSTYLVAGDYRAPFHASTGGRLLANYDFSVPVIIDMRVSEIANEIIHSSQLAVLADGEGPPGDGLLVASDWNMKRRVLHIPITTMRAWVDAVLQDNIALFKDEWDPQTGKVVSVRE